MFRIGKFEKSYKNFGNVQTETDVYKIFGEFFKKFSEKRWGSSANSKKSTFLFVLLPVFCTVQVI